jgi:hypothetical protein
MENLENFTWLIEGSVASDRLLSWDPEILKKIWLMKKMTWPNVVYSQYNDPAHVSSCTKFAPINALATMYQKNFSDKEIQEIEKMSSDAGRRGVWFWRMRSQWVNVARKRRNKHNPTQEIVAYEIDIFSPEREAYMAIWWVAIVSIRVDTVRVRDVNDNLIIDGWDFGKNIGHATSMRLWNRFLDSAFPRKWWEYSIAQENLRRFMSGGNIAPTCHIFLPLKFATMITKDVESNQRYAEAVKWMIENKITTETEKFRPHDTVTRAEMAVFLKRLHDKLSK